LAFCFFFEASAAAVSSILHLFCKGFAHIFRSEVGDPLRSHVPLLLVLLSIFHLVLLCLVFEALSMLVVVLQHRNLIPAKDIVSGLDIEDAE
jgi:hypothetical protein